MKQISLFDFEIIPLYDTVRHAKISDEEYFSNKYKSYISNSKLKLIDSEEGGDPDKYKNGLKSSFNPSFFIGTGVHTQILEPEAFTIHPKCGKPSAKQGYCLDFVKSFRKQGLSIRESINKARQKADYYKSADLDKMISKFLTKENLTYYLKTRDLDDSVLLFSNSD